MSKERPILCLGAAVTMAIHGAACGDLPESEEVAGASSAPLSASFVATADARVEKSNPAKNYGASSSLHADGSPVKRSYLRFEVTGISGVVESANLRLYCTNSSSDGPAVYRTDSGWSESAVTWNNGPARQGSAADDAGSVASGTWLELDVTALVTGNGTFSFILVSTSTDGADFSSREGTNKPQLVVTHTPSGGATSSASSSSSAASSSSSGGGGSDTPASCLEGNGPLVTVSGPQSSAYDKRDDFATATRVDAHAASWTGVSNTPVRIGGGDDICFSGGKIQGTWDPNTTSWETYHDSYGFSVYGNGLVLENLRVDNYGDAITVRTEPALGMDFVIRGAHVTNNHDDCVQNDGMKAGLIDDSLFDGCYVFFSARGYGSGPNNVVTIQNSLARLQPFMTYYQGSTTDPAQARHGGFWKIDEFDKAPKLAIHNNVFRADKDSHSWIPLAPNAKSIASCSNNVIVWLGPGAFPEPLPSCFTVTTDKSVWDNAVATWKAKHAVN